MPLTSFAINGVPLENYGLFVVNADGFLDLPARKYATVQPVQRDGQVPVSQANYTEPRIISIGVDYNSLSGYADRRTKLNALRQALRGRLEVTTVEDPTKAVYGLLQSGAVKPFSNWFLTPEVTETLSIVCHDPMWYDVTPQSVALPALNTDYVIPIGSALLRRMRLVINGNWAGTVTATLKNGAGDTLQTLSSTFAASSSEYLEIQNDPDGPYMRSYSAGVATDRISTIGTTETFLMADPQDAPTLRVDKGTGATLYVYRAWEA